MYNYQYQLTEVVCVVIIFVKKSDEVLKRSIQKSEIKVLPYIRYIKNVDTVVVFSLHILTFNRKKQYIDAFCRIFKRLNTLKHYYFINCLAT